MLEEQSTITNKKVSPCKRCEDRFTDKMSEVCIKCTKRLFYDDSIMDSHEIQIEYACIKCGIICQTRWKKMCKNCYNKDLHNRKENGIYVRPHQSTAKHCTYELCDMPHKAKGLCAFHYDRFQRQNKQSIYIEVDIYNQLKESATIQKITLSQVIGKLIKQANLYSLM